MGSGGGWWRLWTDAGTRLGGRFAAYFMELAITFSAINRRDWNQRLRLWFIPPLK
jgi:hypothetical protein